MPIIQHVFYQKLANTIKLLVEGGDGVYVWGDRVTPQLIIDPNNTIRDFTYMERITSTGPGLNDWVALGIGENYGPYEVYADFYGPDGLIQSHQIYPGTSLPSYNTVVYYQPYGNFMAAKLFSGTTSSTVRHEYVWASASQGNGGFVDPNTGNDNLSAKYGFVLPDEDAGERLFSSDEFSETAPNPDLSLCLIFGNQPNNAEAPGYDGPYASGNPWLFSQTNSPIRIGLDLNSVLSNNRGRLIGNIFYAGDYSPAWDGPPGVSASEVITLTPHTIDTSTGVVSTGSNIDVTYIYTDSDYAVIDWSPWVSP